MMNLNRIPLTGKVLNNNFIRITLYNNNNNKYYINSINIISWNIDIGIYKGVFKQQIKINIQTYWLLYVLKLTNKKNNI